MATDHELAAYVARRFLDAHPAQRAAVEAIIAQLDAGTFVPNGNAAAAAAIAESIAFLNNLAAVTIPAFVAQLTALKTSGVPI